MRTIELFAAEGFGGDEITIMEDTKDLKSKSILEEVKSLKVPDGIWVVFSKANYTGDIAVYKEGEYSSDLKIKDIGSLRKLPGGLEEHVIKIYSGPELKGESATLRGESYKKIVFKVLSHEVVKGVWFLHDEIEFTGNSSISIITDKVLNETGNDLIGTVKSLRAYTTYEDAR